MTCIWYIFPEAGGPGLGRSFRPYMLSRAWISMGHEVHVICASWHHLQDDEHEHNGDVEIDGVPYHFVKVNRYSGNGFSRLRSMWSFPRSMIRDSRFFDGRITRPDVIICTSPHLFSWPAAKKLAARWDSFLVFEVRDIWPLSLIELAGVPRWHPLIWWLKRIERNAYREADLITSLLSGAFEHISTFGVPPERFSFIPNGIDRSIIEGQPIIDSKLSNMLRRLKAEGRFIIIYSGSLGPPNALERLLDAALELRLQKNNDIVFLVVGKGILKEELVCTVEAENLNDIVLFHDPVPKRELLGCLHLADLGYIGWRDRQIYRFGISPNKLFDYLFTGLPVLQAIDSQHDLLTAARVGITVRSYRPEAIAEAILEFKNMSQEERRAIGEKGRAWVLQNHDYQVLAAKYLEAVANRRVTK